MKREENYLNMQMRRSRVSWNMYWWQVRRASISPEVWRIAILC